MQSLVEFFASLLLAFLIQLIPSLLSNIDPGNGCNMGLVDSSEPKVLEEKQVTWGYPPDGTVADFLYPVAPPTTCLQRRLC